MIQLLSEFEKRTEYMVLKDIKECSSVSIHALKPGTVVIPGFVLKKMTDENINTLKSWLDNRNNHLILVPSWIELDIGKIFEASLPLKVKAIDETFYEKTPVRYNIQTMIKDRLFEQDGKIFGINFRKNTGSGLVTVVTLPLLDYKLSQFKDKFKDIFNFLLLFSDEVKEEKVLNDAEIVLDPIHISLIILKAAGIDLGINLKEKIYKYFYIDMSVEEIKDKLNDLKIGGLVQDDKLTDKVKRVIKDRRLKPFIDVVIRKEVSSDGWD